MYYFLRGAGYHWKNFIKIAQCNAFMNYWQFIQIIAQEIMSESIVHIVKAKMRPHSRCAGKTCIMSPTID